MWFKQMTCDCCYRPLRSIGRHNRYYFCKIQDFQKVTPQEFQLRYDYFNNPLEHRFNYDTSPYCYGGYVYSYKTEPLRAKGYSTWFCSKECAVKEAIRLNSLVFYYDEDEDSVAFFTPHTIEINRAISESDYTPLLMMQWGEDNWFQKPSDYQDLSRFGYETKYPEFTTNLCNIVKPTTMLFEDYKKLVLDSEFEKYFWGSNSSAVKERIRQQFPNFIKSVDINFGRRLMIEWFITNKLNQFIGFIHLTCMYPAFPYKWVVEFGLVKEYRGKHIMKTVLAGIIKWAKQNGCDEIYAISEDFNVASHALFNHLPYPVEETTRMMSDQYGGFRPMRNYIISLQDQNNSNRNEFFSMGCQAFQTKDYRSAEKYFQQALDNAYDGGPNTDALCYSNMGMACTSYGNYIKAFQYLKKAQSLGLTNASIERELNWLRVNKGLY